MEVDWKIKAARAAVAKGKAMADWKKLTSPSGDGVYLNLDVMIGMHSTTREVSDE
jgi:hypothetical protein